MSPLEPSEYILEKLAAVQHKLRTQIILSDTFKYPPNIVTGFDLAYMGNIGIVAAVSLDYESFSIIEKKVLVSRVVFPYIPTYLAFREAPLILRSLRSLRVKPDVIMIDGHGVAHPRKLGSATYIGIISKIPTIGIAKRKLCGTYISPPKKLFESTPLILNNDIIGYVIKTRPEAAPIFVSPGSNISLDTSKKIVLRMIKNHKLPEPLYLADRLSKDTKKQLILLKDNQA